MKISTRLMLTGLFSVVVVAIITIVLLTSTQKLKRELDKEAATVEFIKAITVVRFLALEYMMRHEERPLAQWLLSHASLSTLLANTTAFRGTKEQAVIDGFVSAHDSIGNLFLQLVANQSERVANKENTAVLEELDTRLTGQIITKVQSMISEALILSERNRVGVREAQWLTIVAVLLFGGLSVLVVGATMFVTIRRITRPLNELHDGIAVVGAGNLDFRFDMSARDEIGDLARAFDAMTEKLKGTTVSRDQLAEVNEVLKGTTVSRDELAKVNEALKVELDLRQRAEDELKQNEERLHSVNSALEMSNIELQRFAHVASHDLQTPLRSIAGFAQLLQSEYAGRLDARADEWMRRTVHATKVLQTSIQDLLAYSRLHAQEHALEEVSFRDIFDDAILLLDAAIKDSGAQVTCSELPTLLCDHAQLVQLMQNLIGNALKYCTESPRIHVSARADGDSWLFSVRDNGIGIDSKHYERIFEIFKRLHNAQQYPGSGIGLAICRRIIDRHGGKIWVESQPGLGSIFYFTISERKVDPDE